MGQDRFIPKYWFRGIGTVLKQSEQIQGYPYFFCYLTSNLSHSTEKNNPEALKKLEEYVEEKHIR